MHIKKLIDVRGAFFSFCERGMLQIFCSYVFLPDKEGSGNLKKQLF